MALIENWLSFKVLCRSNIEVSQALLQKYLIRWPPSVTHSLLCDTFHKTSFSTIQIINLGRFLALFFCFLRPQLTYFPIDALNPKAFEMLHFGHTRFPFFLHSPLWITEFFFDISWFDFFFSFSVRGKRKIVYFTFDSFPMTFGYFECSSISIYVRFHCERVFDPFLNLYGTDGLTNKAFVIAQRLNMHADPCKLNAVGRMLKLMSFRPTIASNRYA